MLGYVVSLQLPEREGRKGLGVKYDPEASDSGVDKNNYGCTGETHSEDMGAACGISRTPELALSPFHLAGQDLSLS